MDGFKVSATLKFVPSLLVKKDDKKTIDFGVYRLFRKDDKKTIN